MAIGYITHHECLLHDPGDYHPESPARLSAINDRMIASGLNMGLVEYDAPLASSEQLARVHDAEYLEQLFARAPESGREWIDADTAMNSGTIQAALRAAGAVALGVDLVISGRHRRVFCAVRPPGHHAERDRAMGFCFFNNIAVGAYHALEAHGLERVAMIDFDVHHGNGTEHIGGGDARLLFCSTFQHPFYPFSGHASETDNVANVPLAAGEGSEAFRAAVSEHWLPRLQAFAPQLLLVSAGFDAHHADDLAGLNFSTEDYAWVTRELVQVAEQSAQGRIVSTLEGGYELHALARCVETHIKAMLD